MRKRERERERERDWTNSGGNVHLLGDGWTKTNRELKSLKCDRERERKREKTTTEKVSKSKRIR